MLLRSKFRTTFRRERNVNEKPRTKHAPSERYAARPDRSETIIATTTSARYNPGTIDPGEGADSLSPPSCLLRGNSATAAMHAETRRGTQVPSTNWRKVDLEAVQSRMFCGFPRGV